MRPFTLGGLGRDLSRFEMMLALILIGILVMIFLQRLDKLLAHAERASFVTSLGNFRQGLNYELIKRTVLHDYDAIAALDHANPFAVASQSPLKRQGYLGVLNSPVPADLEPGNWYFDDATQYLVYLVDTALAFDSELAGPWRVRLETRLIYEDKDDDGRYSAGERLYGIQLRPVEQVSWNHKVIH